MKFKLSLVMYSVITIISKYYSVTSREVYRDTTGKVKSNIKSLLLFI